MPKFKAVIRFPFLDRATITKALFTKVRRVVVQALLEFLKVALPRVPIATGMAQGTFLPLARALSRSRAGTVPHIATQPLEVGYIYVGGQRVRRTPEGGARRAGPQNIDAIINKLVTQITIKYATSLRYFNLLEFVGGKGHQPWQAYREGAKAFRKYIRTHLRAEVSDVLNIVGYTNINIQGSNVTVIVEKPKVRI